VLREESLERLSADPDFDIAVIGGGATGLGVAVESAARGYRTVLFEQHDFCKGTSSRSTKLVHGGVRYLAQGNVSLVRDALRERGLLLQNAPHLVQRLPMVVPTYRRRQLGYYAIGLKLYDFLSGSLGLGRTRILGSAGVAERLPTVRRKRLQGGVLFFDGQFDDARLGISLLLTLEEQGGVGLNYCAVRDLLVENGEVRGIAVEDRLSGRQLEIRSKIVVNATGAFADHVRRMADPTVRPRISASQGSHIVLEKRFLPGETALLVPKTDDGRVLFAIPWHDRVVVGTTDVPVSDAELEPRPSAEEVDFILAHVGRYLEEKPTRSDVMSVFAGLRPLVGHGDGRSARTSALSRDHVVEILGKRLISVLGGKWTTYRKMAQDAVDRAVEIGPLAPVQSPTAGMKIHGAVSSHEGGIERCYGSDRPALEKLVGSEPALGESLHPRLPYRKVSVVWGARRESACTLEDILARRTRSILLDARASIEAAPAAARLLARELGRDKLWEESQVQEFNRFAERYLLNSR
jgi:glycerol-3-phosphate dehydrogenase